MGKILAILLCLVILCTGCGSDSKKSSNGKGNGQISTEDILNKPLTQSELEAMRQDSLSYLQKHPDNDNHKIKVALIEYHLKNNESPSENQIMREIEDYKVKLKQKQRDEAEAKKKQEEAEAKRRQAEANIFQFSNFTLDHRYNEILPYNAVKMTFVVKNTSDSVQTLRLKDFVLQKEGSNTILPEDALRNHTGIAKNPSNPDFSEYDSILNQRDMYPGDSFFVKIEFWEQRELIKSLEGWYLVHMNKNNANKICKLN